MVDYHKKMFHACKQQNNVMRAFSSNYACQYTHQNKALYKVSSSS